MNIQDVTKLLKSVPPETEILFETQGTKLTLARFYRTKQRGENLMTIEFNERPDKLETAETTLCDYAKITAKDLLEKLAVHPPNMQLSGTLCTQTVLDKKRRETTLGEILQVQKPHIAIIFPMTPVDYPSYVKRNIL